MAWCGWIGPLPLAAVTASRGPPVFFTGCPYPHGFKPFLPRPRTCSRRLLPPRRSCSAWKSGRRKWNHRIQSRSHHSSIPSFHFCSMLIAFNKPFGVLSQFTTDGSSNRTLADFVFPRHVYPIGRLDADSEGLLLLSDEAEWNQRLL